MITIKGPEEVARYRKLVLLKALKLEIAGMRRRGRSAYSIIKSEFGLTGSRKKVYEDFEQLINSNGGVS